MLRRMARFLIVCSAAVCSIVPAGFARIVTVKITAEVTNVEVLPELGQLGDDLRHVAESVQIGDPVEGIYAYDTSAPDLSAYGWRGTYQFDARPCGIAVSANGFVFKTNPEAVSLTIGTTNDLQPIEEGPREEFGLASHENLMIPESDDLQCHGIALVFLALWPNDPLGDDSLPVSTPPLEDWDVRTLEFGVYRGERPSRGGGWGTYESIEITAVVTSAELLPDPAWVLYVDAAAAPGGDGLSWPTAYASLQDAIANAATVGNTEIRVAQGVYKPDQGAGRTPGDRMATFTLVSGLALKGGYAGLAAPDPNARNIELYETILSGDLADNDVEVDHPHDLRDEPTRAENSYHVVTASGTNRSAIIEGFTITGGYAEPYLPRNPLPYEHEGGGMYLDEASPKVLNCTFNGNLAADGGGMFSRFGNPLVTGCCFLGNMACVKTERAGDIIDHYYATVVGYP